VENKFTNVLHFGCKKEYNRWEVGGTGAQKIDENK
jgi:hypothetical protein